MSSTQCTHVLMSQIKDEQFHFRIKSDVKDEFRIVAELRGLTPSALLHSLIIKAIREEKEQSPKAFDNEAIKKKDSSLKIPNLKISTSDEISEEIGHRKPKKNSGQGGIDFASIGLSAPIELREEDFEEIPIVKINFTKQ